MSGKQGSLRSCRPEAPFDTPLEFSVLASESGNVSAHRMVVVAELATATPGHLWWTTLSTYRPPTLSTERKTCHNFSSGRNPATLEAKMESSKGMSTDLHDLSACQETKGLQIYMVLWQTDTPQTGCKTTGTHIVCFISIEVKGQGILKNNNEENLKKGAAAAFPYILTCAAQVNRKWQFLHH